MISAYVAARICLIGSRKEKNPSKILASKRDSKEAWQEAAFCEGNSATRDLDSRENQ